jgi:hypothetical protein
MFDITKPATVLHASYPRPARWILMRQEKITYLYHMKTGYQFRLDTDIMPIAEAVKIAKTNDINFPKKILD